MLKAAIEKIAALATPEVYTVGADTYTTNQYFTRVAPHADRPEMTGFTSLDGIVKAVRAEIDRVSCPVFINPASYSKVRAFTTYRQDNMGRDHLYTAEADLPAMPSGWMDHETAMIILRSQFSETEGTEYILQLLSSISDETSLRTSDNGMTQTVNVKQGVALQTTAQIRPRVKLKPFRTFLEVDQPESEFLLRMRAGSPDKGTSAQIGLFEADGGAWKLQAKHNIAAYFEDKLAELIQAGKVIVAE